MKIIRKNLNIVLLTEYLEKGNRLVRNPINRYYLQNKTNVNSINQTFLSAIFNLYGNCCRFRFDRTRFFNAG